MAIRAKIFSKLQYVTRGGEAGGRGSRHENWRSKRFYRKNKAGKSVTAKDVEI